MEQIFKEYAGPIIAVIVTVALAGIVTFLLATDGAVATAFQTLITNFVAKAGTLTS